MTAIFAGLAIAAVIVGGYFGARAYWPDWTARFWALAGNSRTILAGYAVQLLGLLDELKLVDWSSWFGADRAGRITMVLGVMFIGLRLITRTEVSWKKET